MILVFFLQTHTCPLLDTAPPVTAERKEGVLSGIRIVDNELLVFGNHEKVKVEFVRNLGFIGSVKVLPNLINIIVVEK